MKKMKERKKSVPYRDFLSAQNKNENPLIPIVNKQIVAQQRKLNILQNSANAHTHALTHARTHA